MAKNFKINAESARKKKYETFLSDQIKKSFAPQFQSSSNIIFLNKFPRDSFWFQHKPQYFEGLPDEDFEPAYITYSWFGIPDFLIFRIHVLFYYSVEPEHVFCNTNFSKFLAIFGL